ncbi:ATP-binding protein [Methylobacterium sp. 092160098-2]|uniref:AAA family ATPase n=1 Tax=Methylobacterium sp. 092160098-2 TaxID=3025129 RepID=UPI0023819D8E|nr:ATP-binding protein [Methylobacterium sp. 092160098-2]MDE4910854.1 ATP-binding protein [Methylobacterium sp. 092160098-2]
METLVPAWLNSALSSLGRVLGPVGRRFLARRGAEQGLPSTSPEFDEALDVLSGGDGLLGKAFTGAKAWASEVPVAFKEPNFQLWARDLATREVFVRAATRRWQNLPSNPEDEATAIKRYAVLASDAQQRAYRPYEDAINFLVLSVQSVQSASERAAAQKGNADRKVIVDAIASQGDRIDATLTRMFEGGSSRLEPLNIQGPTYTADELAELSSELLSWPSDINGHVMPRPELDELEERLTAPQTEKVGRSVLLFGPPGSGKSAVLATLGKRLRARGATVIGIKADALPADISTVADLGPALDLGEDIVAEISAQTTRGAVYVLIDQLDAVASLIDGSGGRLRALGSLARRLRAWPEIRVIASVRPFEFAADGGFRTAFPEAVVDRVDLSLPARADVNEVLTALELNPAEIPAALDEVIRVPQALRDIVAARRAGFAWSAMATWRSTQALRFDRLVAVHPTLGLDRLIEHLVGALRSTGTLWSAYSSLPLGSTQAVDRLCAEGILRRRDESGLVGFAHQTWAETLDARLALAQGDLATRVIEAGKNLLARPQALGVLRYAREAAPDIYDAAIKDLWSKPELRRHLKHLILDLAAAGDDPTQGERHIVIGVVAGDDSALAERALRLSAGKPKWFELLRGPVSDRMASVADERARSVWPWLSSNATNNGIEVLDLLHRHWQGHPSHERLIPHVLEHLETWNDRAYELFRGALVSSLQVNVFSVGAVRQQAKVGRHDVAAKLVGLLFDQIVTRIKLRIGSGVKVDAKFDASDGDDGLTAAFSRLQAEHDRSVSYQLAKELRELHGLYDFAEIVRKSPKPYVDELLPRFYDMGSTDMAELAEEDFRELQSAGRQAAKYDLQLVEGLRVGLEELSRIDPPAFWEAISRIAPGNQLLDRLIASALAVNIEVNITKSLDFLEADRCRLRLGDRFENDQGDTLDLISALSACADQQANDRLVAYISSWNEYEIDSADDVKHRRMTRYWNRLHRARLLECLKIERLSGPSRRYVQEELRAVPAADRVRTRSVSGWVHSPMSTDGMERASDEHLLRLFSKLPDGVERWHADSARTSLVGGSREASMAFGELAKRQPARVLKLIKRFSPQTHQVPVGAALRAISETNLIDPGEMLVAIDEALSRGFDGNSFRHDVIWALHQIVQKLPGLEDRWVKALLCWMRPFDVAGAQSELIDTAYEPRKRPLPGTVLFENGRLRLASGGENSTILRVCSLAILRREPRDYSIWLDMLEDHLEKPESSAVWGDLSILLGQLAWADRSRASSFVAALMKSQPEFRDSEDSARLIARLLRVLPQSTIDDVLSAWRASDWPLASIAIGEIEALRAALFGPGRSVEDWLELASAGPVFSDVVAGVANVAVAFWDEAETKPRVWSRRVLPFLATRQEPRVAQACVDFFRRVAPWPAEDDTRHLLRVFSNNPVALQHASASLADDRLGDLLEDPLAHEAILDFMEASIRSADRKLADYRGTGPMLARGLIPIVLTLHREANFRERTLGLFESILDVLPDETEGLLKELQ